MENYSGLGVPKKNIVVDLGQCFFDSKTGKVLVLMDTLPIDNNNFWCCEINSGETYFVALPVGLLPSKTSLKNAPSYMREMVECWASNGSHRAMYWLFRHLVSSDIPKATWYLVAAYRKMPRRYYNCLKRTFEALKSRLEQNFFILEIPEFSKLDNPDAAWGEALSTAFSL